MQMEVFGFCEVSTLNGIVLRASHPIATKETYWACPHRCGIQACAVNLALVWVGMVHACFSAIYIAGMDWAYLL